jgi:hypothetical protein
MAKRAFVEELPEPKRHLSCVSDNTLLIDELLLMILELVIVFGFPVLQLRFVSKQFARVVCTAIKTQRVKLRVYWDDHHDRTTPMDLFWSQFVSNLHLRILDSFDWQYTTSPLHLFSHLHTLYLSDWYDAEMPQMPTSLRKLELGKSVSADFSGDELASLTSLEELVLCSIPSCIFSYQGCETTYGHLTRLRSLTITHQAACEARNSPQILGMRFITQLTQLEYAEFEYVFADTIATLSNLTHLHCHQISYQWKNITHTVVLPKLRALHITRSSPSNVSRFVVSLQLTDHMLQAITVPWKAHIPANQTSLRSLRLTADELPIWTSPILSISQFAMLRSLEYNGRIWSIYGNDLRPLSALQRLIITEKTFISGDEFLHLPLLQELHLGTPAPGFERSIGLTLPLLSSLTRLSLGRGYTKSVHEATLRLRNLRHLTILGDIDYAIVLELVLRGVTVV